mgnify:CR=1 FL=1
MKSLLGKTDIPFDVHLMIEDPDKYIDDFVTENTEYITVHAEACTHINRTLQHIKSKGVKAGVALNPGTPLSVLDYVLEDADMILVMSVNPGFGGQKYIESSGAKLRRLRRLCTDHGVSPLIEVDGGVNAQTAAEVCEAGANVLVAGSAVFGKQDRADAISQIRAAAESGLSKKA